jgi:signal transduction histidine kinase
MYAQNTILNDIESEAPDSISYTLTTYPSKRMLEEFKSNSSFGIAIGFVAVILFSAALFFLYDFFMRHESQQRKVILEVKRRFVRFVSHEIRTPLNTVCLGLELLQAEMDPHRRTAESKKTDDVVRDDCSQSLLDYDEKRGNWLQLTDDILENANNAVGILNDLLNYDKIEQGTFNLEVGTVHIWEVIRSTVSAFHIQAEKRQIDLTLSPANSTLGTSGDEQRKLPDLQRLHVVGDDTRLRQVIRNLISNSLKFSPEKTGVIQVSATYDPDGLPRAAAPKTHILHKVSSTKLESLHPRAGSVVIKVVDNGVGMTQEQLGHLFQEGVQFDANKHQVCSFGCHSLTLSIAQITDFNDCRFFSEWRWQWFGVANFKRSGGATWWYYCNGL